MCAVPLTIREVAPPATAGAERLVPELARRFHAVGRIWSAPGTVAYRCTRRGADPEAVVVKQTTVPPRPGAEELQAVARHLDARGLLIPTERGRAGDRHWSVTPFLGAGSLAERRSAPSPVELEQLVRGLRAALDPLHGAGFAHADLHPGNILFADNSWANPSLIDFDLTVRGSVQLNPPTDGVPAYLAPEALALGNVAAAGDWWAVGIVVVELLTGRHPFGSRAEPASVVARLHLTGADPTVAVADTRWRTLIGGLLSRDPGRRWSSEQVGAWLEGRSVITPGAPPPSGPPFVWDGIEARSLDGLALALTADWDRSIEVLRGDPMRAALRRWVEANGGIRPLLDLLDRGPGGDRQADLDAFLTHVVTLAAPSFGPCFAGPHLTVRDLAGRAQLAVLPGAAGASQRAFVKRLHEAGALRILAGLPHEGSLAAAADAFDQAWHDIERAVRKVGKAVSGLGAGQRDELVVAAGGAVLGTLLDQPWSAYWEQVLARIDTEVASRTAWFGGLLEAPLHDAARALLADRLQAAARSEALSA